MGRCSLEQAPRLAFHPGWIVWGVVLSGAVLLQFVPQGFAVACPWKQWLNVPCVTCGATRSALAMSQFQVAQALSFNPLFALGMMAGALVALAALLQLLTGRKLILRFHPAIAKRWPLILVGLLTANELYLILNQI